MLNKGRVTAEVYSCTWDDRRQVVLMRLTWWTSECVCVCVRPAAQLREVQVAVMARGYLHCHSPHVCLPRATQHPWVSQTAPAVQGCSKQVTLIWQRVCVCACVCVSAIFSYTSWHLCELCCFCIKQTLNIFISISRMEAFRNFWNVQCRFWCLFIWGLSKLIKWNQGNGKNNSIFECGITVTHRPSDLTLNPPCEWGKSGSSEALQLKHLATSDTDEVNCFIKKIKKITC